MMTLYKLSTAQLFSVRIRTEFRLANQPKKRNDRPSPAMRIRPRAFRTRKRPLGVPAGTHVGGP